MIRRKKRKHCVREGKPLLARSSANQEWALDFVLDAIIAERGIAGAIRVDNGPEFTSRHFLAWCVERQIELIHIQPGKPTQNGRIESFHGRLREECLRVSWFQNLFDARRKLAAWRIEYNEERPH